LILERKIYKKRGLIGYNPKEVEDKIQSLRDLNQREQERLEQEITAEREKNKMLKAKLDEFIMKSFKNIVSEELTLKLKDQFFQHTKSILELKVELQERESKLQEQFEKKMEQKELAQKQIQNALQYLNIQKTELKKELIK
jgi:glycerol-3-phosphate dehydrogenase